MNIYFIIYYGIAMLNLGIALANHGKKINYGLCI